MIELRSGSTLGRYEILTQVAQGGMATVWAARLVGSRGFSKIVAVKTMLPSMVDDPDFELMFLDEARIASQIRHPHVVEIIDLGEDHAHDLVFLVMEWVNGETLFTLNKRAKEHGGTPLPLLLHIASCTASGLHAAHELRDESGYLRGLVHRDVSPQNVMISFDGFVKICDFGVAKATGRAYETRVGGLMKGKVPYLSPEQLMGKRDIDRRADIFSLGTLMYVMISGRHPFRGPTDSNTMENICTKEAVPLTELVPDVNPELAGIVHKSLAKDPNDRYETCAEVQRALDHVQASLGVTVTDGDVASFVKRLMGDLITERAKKLEAAIKKSDERAASGPPKPDPRASRPSGAGIPPAPSLPSGPLPATYGGFLPVALDGTELPRPAAPDRPISVSPVVSTPPSARIPVLPILGVVAIVLVLALAAGIFFGWVPLPFG